MKSDLLKQINTCDYPQLLIEMWNNNILEIHSKFDKIHNLIAASDIDMDDYKEISIKLIEVKKYLQSNLLK